MLRGEHDPHGGAVGGRVQVLGSEGGGVDGLCVSEGRVRVFEASEIGEAVANVGEVATDLRGGDERGIRGSRRQSS